MVVGGWWEDIGQVVDDVIDKWPHSWLIWSMDWFGGLVGVSVDGGLAVVESG